MNFCQNEPRLPLPASFFARLNFSRQERYSLCAILACEIFVFPNRVGGLFCLVNLAANISPLYFRTSINEQSQF
jgi:hypothetical protein